MPYVRNLNRFRASCRSDKVESFGERLTKVLTIGIPSKGVTYSLLRVLGLSLSFPFIEEVIVGINPGVNEVKFPSSLTSDPRVKLFYHQTDLGLYGNFRFLANQASNPYFMWLCTDDTPTPQLEALLQVAFSEQVNLVIPTWVLSEYFPHLQEHAKERERGSMPSLDSNRLRAKSALEVDPSWMFGVWKTRYLVSIFPKRDFDWLDVHILRKVLISNSVKLVEVPEPTIIGTWVWASKLPHSVKPSGHSPNLAILHQLATAPSLLLLWPPVMRSILRSMVNLSQASKQLNARKKRAPE